MVGDKNFCISQKYIDPKFYEKENTSGFLSDYRFSRKLQESQTLQRESLNRIAISLENVSMGLPPTLLDHSNFDPLFQLCSNFPKLHPEQKTVLAEILWKTAETFVASLPKVNVKKTEKAKEKGKTEEKSESHPSETENKKLFLNTAKCLSFLLCTLLNVAEKSGEFKKKSSALLNGFDGVLEKERILGSVLMILNSKTILNLWDLNTPEEEYGGMFFKTAITMFESTYNKDKCSNEIFDIISVNMKRHGSLKLTFSATFTHLLLNRERFSKKVAKLCAFLAKEESQEDVVGNMVRGMARLDEQSLSKNLKGAESVGEFLKELSELFPPIVYSNLEAIIEILSSSSYKMRNGVLEVFGILIENLDEIIEKMSEVSHVPDDGMREGEESRSKFADKTKEKAFAEVDNLLNLIEQRTLDVVSYTRSKSLSVLNTLANEQSIPFPEHLLKLVKISRKRLKERNVNVRKNAIRLLKALVVNNYPEQLEDFKRRKEQLEGILNFVEEAEEKINEDKENENAGNKKLSDKAHKKLNLELESVSKAVEFAKEVQDSMESVCEVLALKGNFDVVECIDFFFVASELDIEGWKKGFKRMFSLIWNKDTPNIIDAVLEAYYKRYIFGGKRGKRDGVNQSIEKEIAKNFSKLVGEMESHKELTCLEEIIILMCRKKKIPEQIIMSFFNYFENKFKNAIRNERRPEKKFRLASNSLFILSVISSEIPSLFLNFDRIEKLLSLFENVFDVKSANFYNSILLDNVMMVKSFYVLVERCNNGSKIEESIIERMEKFGKALIFEDKVPDRRWFPLAQQILMTIIRISPRAELFVDKILRDFWSVKDIKDPKDFSRFLFILGNSAMGVLFLLEKAELKLKSIRNKKEKEQQSRAGKNEKRNSILMDYYKMSEGEKEYQIEQVREKAENNLVSPEGLLGAYGKAMLFVCENIIDFESQTLKKSAVMALSKFMCVSKPFCSQKLPLLFRIMEEEKDSVLVTNIVISLGDITSRFPNLVSLYTSRMFAPLKHPEVSVRKNTLLVLSHLILNDMVKVRESISEIALIVADSEKAVRDLARLFFQEFAKKGKNPIHNILPDVVSKLTHDKVPKSTFEAILKELVRYISEEKTQETFIYKLCSRFSKLKEEEEIENNVYCLTLLSYGEKCFKKLFEMSKTYKHLLKNAKILEAFKSIVKRAKKSALKQEVKDLISEFEEKVIRHRAENREEIPPEKNGTQNEEGEGNEENLSGSGM